MTEDARRGGSIIPTLRYTDGAGAIEWLCETFGFEQHLVVPNEDGSIAHAELTLGDAMIMLGSAAGEGDYRKWVQPPARSGDVVHFGIYVVTPDVEAHYARALAQGVEILLPLTEQDYGGSDYTCRDLQGYVWTFGSYDPWTAPPSE